MSGLVVRSLSVGLEGTSTVTIQWTAPSPGSDQVNRYEVHWTPTLSNGTSNYNAAKSTLVKLTGFTSGQRYTFYVKSIEDGSRSSQQEVQTSPEAITINAGLNVVCDGGITCADSNSECIQAATGGTNICRCKSTYFDSNGYATNGGMCVLMSKLAVTNVILVKEGTDMVNISWTLPAEYTNQVNRYEVYWIPAKSDGSTSYNAELNTAVQLAGFTPGQTYTFSVRSVESGSRDQEQSYSTSTPATIMKPTTPSGFRETDVDGPVIILSWTLPSGISTSYDVRTTPTLNPTTTSTESIAYTSGVLDGQRYNITITTVSGSERSDPLEAKFRTVSKTPNPPTSIFCKAPTDQTITLGWTAPSLSRGDIQHYVVISITTGAMFTTTSSLADFTVGGLQPETIYTFSVATVNDAVTYTNRSIYSSQIGCTTKAASE
ncbi:receptor-type tyrosine-protein phosphatase H-like [Pecten maximus]|uniref:receptor-type tyrosine-protein phosphatase H-like n=1 Tax=Pecten maximus TaxID=6579 RepID=UPI001457F8F3|nr:receptor-type tyrosine-protein phosphatase H-like [Pecten maximus]